MATNIAAVANPFGPGLAVLLTLRRKAGPVAAFRMAVELQGLIKKELSKPGSGRLYRSENREHLHQASAPGEPPAVDLGDLRRSIGIEAVGDDLLVGTGEERAKALEFGHIYADGRVLAPRPYFRPAFKRLPERTQQLVGDLTATRLGLRGAD